MTAIEWIIGIILILLAAALVVLISLQQSKRHGLGNSIAGQGASESYLTRNKIAGREKTYQKLTLIIAIVFVVIVVALFIIYSASKNADETTSGTAQTSSVAETSSAADTSVEESVAESVAEPAESSVATE